MAEVGRSRIWSLCPRRVGFTNRPERAGVPPSALAVPWRGALASASSQW